MQIKTANIPYELIEWLILTEISVANGTMGNTLQDAIKRNPQEQFVRQGRASLVVDLINIYNQQNPKHRVQLQPTLVETQ